MTSCQCGNLELLKQLLQFVVSLIYCTHVIQYHLLSSSVIVNSTFNMTSILSFEKQYNNELFNMHLANRALLSDIYNRNPDSPVEFRWCHCLWAWRCFWCANCRNLRTHMAFSNKRQKCLQRNKGRYGINIWETTIHLTEKKTHTYIASTSHDLAFNNALGPYQQVGGIRPNIINERLSYIYKIQPI